MAPGCLGYIGDEISYPVNIGIIYTSHEIRIQIQPTILMECQQGLVHVAHFVEFPSLLKIKQFWDMEGQHVFFNPR